MMQRLPREVVEYIFDFLDGRSRLIVAAVCCQWLSMSKKILANSVRDLRVTFEECACQMGMEPQIRQANGSCSYEIQLSLCQCEQHQARHLHFLHIFVPIIVPNLKQLILEDYFILRASFIAASTFDAILGVCSVNSDNLECLEMHNVDFSKAPPRCLMLIGRMRQLGQLSLVQCTARQSNERFRLHDRIYASMLRPGTFAQLHLTHSPFVTDRLLNFIARTCISLWYFNLTGCKNITAKGISHFCETLHVRQPDIIYLELKSCDYVKGEELQRHLLCDDSPAYKLGPWTLSHVPLGIASVVSSQAATAACASSLKIPHKRLLMIA